MKLAMAALALLSLGSLTLTTGCETLSETSAENGNRKWHHLDTNRRQIAEDVDMLLLLDRPSWLSEKPVPNQYWEPQRVYPDRTPYYTKTNP